MPSIVLLALLLVGGCGGNDGLDDSSLAGIAPSSRMAPYLGASLRSLASPDEGEPQVRLDLERFVYLQQAMYDQSRRDVAVDSLFALWRARPDHVLWPELAVRERWRLGEGDRRDELFSMPICADTSSSIGAYMLGWRLHTNDSYTKQFRIARTRSGDLEPFAVLWIDLKAAFGERRAGRPEHSADIAFGVLSQAGELGGKRLEALVWEEIARAMMATGELDDALHAVAMADTLMSVAISPGGAIVGLLQIRELRANILAARRDTQASFALYEANAKSAASLELAYIATRNLSRAGTLAEAVGNRDQGFQFCQRGLEFALADRDSLNVPRMLMNVARRFRLRGDLDSCLVYQQRAVHWITAYPDSANVARMPLMQAEYHAQVGEYAIVDSLLNAAVLLSDPESTSEARAELHLELIRGWMETDRPDLIYRSIMAIDDLSDHSGDTYADRHVSAELNLLIGEFQTHNGEFILAAESLDIAASALERRPNPTRSWTLARNRGLLARERGNLAAAENAFRDCITYGEELGTPELESTGRFLLGSVLLAEGRYAEARSAFPSTDAASFVGRFTTRISALLLTGISYASEGNYDLALQVFDEARQACRSWSPPDLMARIDLETGRALFGAGRVEEAVRYFDDVAAGLDRNGSANTSPELAYFNGDLRRDLLEATILLPTSDPASTLRRARNVLPHWRAGPSAKDQRLSSPQIVFFVGERASGRWVIDGDDVQWTQLPGERELKDMLAPVLADMAVPGRPIIDGDVRRLSEVLLRNVGDVWHDGTTLSIVPDLALFGVPWAAMVLPGEIGSLIDHGPLAILDMPSAALDGQRVHGSTGRLLVVGANGDMAAENNGLSSLHHAEREAKDVASAWPTGRTVLRVGDDASRALTASADLASFEAIHVASHAMVFQGRSDKTMLLLEGDQDDALSATNIRDLDLDAELVFLSCCEAADGRDKRSGYAGLARSFLDAGARNVVAPLIIIDDEAARTMATRFYAHWLAGHPVPDALRAAQLDLRDGDTRWSHPFYWAFYQSMIAEAPAMSYEQ